MRPKHEKKPCLCGNAHRKGAYMMTNFLIIAPTQKMLDAMFDAMRINQIGGSVYVKLIGRDQPTHIPASFALVDDAEDLSNKSLKVLCCSE